MNRRKFVGLAGAAAGAAAIGSLASRIGGFGSGEGGDAPIIASASRRTFPNPVLQSQDNRQVRFYDDLLKNKTVLINFMFTGCADLCPLTTLNLRRVQDLLGSRVGKDVFLYSITLDPQNDTPEVLAQHARDFGVKPGWLFLTGETADIEVLRRHFGFVDPDPVVDANKDQHVGMCWLGHEPLQRWSACPSLSEPSSIVDYISWGDVKGRRPGLG